MIHQRFSVEFDRRTVGVAVGVPGGFMFFAADEEFREMNGRLFPRVRSMERELVKVAKKRRQARPRQSANFSFA